MSNHLKRIQGTFGQPKPSPLPGYRATITIGLLPTGQVQVTGPLHYKDLCEQMLDEAFKELRKFHARSEADENNPTPSIIQAEPKIILPN